MWEKNQYVFFCSFILRTQLNVVSFIISEDFDIKAKYCSADILDIIIEEWVLVQIYHDIKRHTFFSFRILLVLCGQSFLFIPATMANNLRLRRISIPDFIHYNFSSYLDSWERASINLPHLKHVTTRHKHSVTLNEIIGH